MSTKLRGPSKIIGKSIHFLQKTSAFLLHPDFYESNQCFLRLTLGLIEDVSMESKDKYSCCSLTSTTCPKG